MSILARWKVGAIALQVAKAASELIQSADFAAALSVLGKIVELEPLDIPGAEKLKRLIAWFAEQYPNYNAALSVIRDFASVVVALMKAVQLFRGGAK